MRLVSSNQRQAAPRPEGPEDALRQGEAAPTDRQSVEVLDVGAVVFFNLREDGALLLEPARGRAQSYGRLERGRRRRNRGQGGYV